MASLQSLPESVLDVVFQHVQTPDLLKIACLSKSLYRPAVRRLYHSITISDRKNTSWANRNSRLWKVNYGTVMHSMRLGKLFNAVRKNPFLAGLVRSVTIEACQEPFRNALEITLRAFPELTALYDHKRFVNLSNSDRKWEKLSCSLNNAPSHFTPNLVELRLGSLNRNQSVDDYNELAENLIEADAHTSLRKLVFYSEEKPVRRMFVQPWPDACMPTWVGFFTPFIFTEDKMNLDFLGLNGDTAGDAKFLVDAIGEAVDLSVLRGLELKINEEGHRTKNDKVPTFLETIAARTPKLEYLSVGTSGYHWPWEVNSWCHTMYEIIPNQLKHLEIGIVPRILSQVQILKIIIALKQTKLERLKIDDETEIFGVGQADAAEEARRRRLFPRIAESEHPRARTSKQNAKSVRRYIAHVANALDADDIETSGRKVERSLVEYEFAGLSIDVKGRGVKVNNYVVPFTRANKAKRRQS